MEESLKTEQTANALKVINKAEEEAIHKIALAAAEALKVNGVVSANDHDFLLTFSSEVKTKLDIIGKDVKELKDGTTHRIDCLENEKLDVKDSYPVLYRAGVEATLKDHEDRIRVNTDRIVRIMTWGSALLVIVGILEFFINRFWR